MSDQCHLCKKEANRHITLKSGEVMHCCGEHFNQWFCERMDLDYEQYVPPKTITVSGKRYKVAMEFFEEGVIYYAYRGISGVEESYTVSVPYSFNSWMGMEHLKEKVAMLLNHATDDTDRLDPNGTIGIAWEDPVAMEGVYFIHKGRKMTATQLGQLLALYVGQNLIYFRESRIPEPGAQWFATEESLLSFDIQGEGLF